MRKIIFVHGDKGGVGKTEAAKRTAAVLSDPSLTLVDGDAKNPGLFAAFSSSSAPVRRHNVLKTAGLEELFETLASVNGDVLIDLPAGASAATERMTSGGSAEGTIDLELLMSEIKAQPVVIFVIDQNREPIAALRDELQAFPEDTKWIIVRNTYEDRAFDVFEASQTKQAVEERGGIVIDMARLDPSVNQMMAAEKLNLLTVQESPKASVIQKIRAKAALREWRAELVKAGLING